MKEPIKIYCPLCRGKLCETDDAGLLINYFGCDPCGLVFHVGVRNQAISEALRALAEGADYV